MATAPVRRIRRHALAFSSVADYIDTMTELAGLPPMVVAPYVTASLDWRPLGEEPGRRPALEQFERDAVAELERRGPRGTVVDSLARDIDRIRAFLADALDPAARGVWIVACDVAEVFVTVPLGLPLDTRLDIGPIPALAPLTRLVEDNVPYAVLVADQQNATLSVVIMASAEAAVDIAGSGYPRKQATGGWSQKRFQARADERVAAFARSIADEVRRTLLETGVTMLIVAGDEIITSALRAAFHPSVAERVIAEIRLDINASDDDVLAATLPIATQHERAQELRDTQTLLGRVRAEGAAAAGAQAVLRALASGQVAQLLLNDDFDAPAWADYTLPLFGIGAPPEEHPAGGDPAKIVPTSARDEMVRLALTTGASIQIVHSAEPVTAGAGPGGRQSGEQLPRSEAARILDELGGVGAVLRYQVTPEAS